MILLTVNGIELPIARDSVERGEIEIGSSGRSFSGAAWKSVRARKQTLSLTTAPMALADADAWSALLNGRAVNWDFEADSYSLQGHAATMTGSAARSTAQYKFGTASLTAPSASMASWTVGAGASWTVARWCRWLNPYTAEWAWDHQVITSAGGSYLNGASFAGGPASLAVVYQAVVISYNADSGTTYSDDVWFLPAVVPASWPAAMYAHGAQLPASPSLTVAGDLLGTTLTMQARVSKRKPVETAAGILWSLPVEFEEA